MCLNIRKVDKLEPKIAQEDIVCYKILINDLHEWLTPCFYELVDRNIVNGNEVFRAIGDEEISDRAVTNVYEIGMGFIHTFIKQEDAEKQLFLWNKSCQDEHFLFKCIIPKGTEYYEGEDDLGRGSYASKVIRFIEQVKL